MTTAGTLSCGTGIVLTEGEPEKPTTILMKQKRGTVITSLYDEEKAAIYMAFEWIFPSHATLAICTDIQPTLKDTQAGSADTADLRHMLNKRADNTILLCIPGHQGIAGNVEAGCMC